jgi:hypothetical protein
MGEDAPARLRLRPEALAWQQVGEEVVMLGFERSEYLATNRSGTLLWPMLADGATAEDLAGALRQRWSITAEQAHADVDAFLAELRAQGLLES